jgi:hypothetical protein
MKLIKINKDFVMVICLILLPFAFYLYNFAPDTKIWKNSWFIIDSGYFEDANSFLWYFCVKLLTLLTITLWFLTCTQKWRFILLFPIISEFHKLIRLFNYQNTGVEFDEFNLMKTIICSSLYITLLFLLSKKLNYYKSYNNDVTPLNNEINNQIIKLSDFDKKQYKSVKEDLRLLDVQKGNMDKKEYLKQLIILRDQLTIIY